MGAAGLLGEPAPTGEPFVVGRGQDLFGHSNVAFTMMTYSHPDAEMAATAMEAVEGSLGDALADR